MQKFIGRKKELQKLEELALLKRPKIVVIKGRRRIGKSRLVQEFAKSKRFFSFSGIAPSRHMGAQDQRNTFALQLSTQIKQPIDESNDWSKSFALLSDLIDQEPTVVLLDEISWMGNGDPSFTAKLKNWWDLELQKFPNLILVFCSSVSTWIEENIVNSTAFFGRITLNIELEPLSMAESTQLLQVNGFKGSTYEILKILSLTGGIPWYLEQISPSYMADQNIKHLCFEKGGMLVNEFDHIFNDLFQHRGKIYKEILALLKDGMRPLTAIRESLGYSESGTLSGHMRHLITAGFVTKHAQWSIITGKVGKQSLYRLSDPYLRFYLKYIEPQQGKITQNFFDKVDLNQIVGFDSIMGFQVENLLLQDRTKLIDSIGVNTTDCVFDNPYFQKQSATRPGLQVDYLVQTRSRNIFVCEFKFSKGRISGEVIAETQDKMKKLSVPRGFAVAPVLFYLGELSETIITSNFFYRSVDISRFLEQ